MITHDLRESIEFEGHVVEERETKLDFQTRYNVLTGWLMEWVLNEINLFNNQFHLKTFLKQCDHLGKRFPLHEDLGHINDIRIIFWSKYQTKIKIMIHQQHKLNRYQAMNDLYRMRFL